jgi:Mg2+ and Co2+ transporter CorA
MNLDFPGFGSVEAFWIIAGVLVATLVGMVGFFRWKRWI